MKIPFPICLFLAFTLLGGRLLHAQESRLSNLAVRAEGGSGGDSLITGFTIGPGASKPVLIRAIGPTLGTFGVVGGMPDPKLELFSGTNKIAENDNWEAPDAATFSSVGAFALGANSKDAAIVRTLAPGSYSAQVNGVGASGIALVEVYELAGATTRLINLSTRARVGTGANLLIPGITIAPGTGTRRLLIRAVGPTLGGFGVADTLGDPKLELSTSTGKVAENDNWGNPVGANAATPLALGAAFTQAGAFGFGGDSKDAAILADLGAGSYTLQVSGVADTAGIALLEIYDLTPENQTGARPNASLYIARLRPAVAAVGSTASGIATIAINRDGSASVNVTFSNLSSTQTSAHLVLGSGQDYVMSLPRGQVSGAFWSFAPAGAYTTNDLIHALNTGNISVSLDSARFPSGELRGTFTSAEASRSFTPPAPPPALPTAALTSPTQTDAARFLIQATFGPTSNDIERVENQGISHWLDEQLSLPATSVYATALGEMAKYPNPPAPPGVMYEYFNRWGNWGSTWLKVAATAPDQLRQRVAFALSQILVVGDGDQITHNFKSKLLYYDILVNGAFGNFRQMLENVTLSPTMGWWLTYLGNMKANPAKGSSPDENYAREIQQLFTIGLVQLHPDGTVMLDETGQPIPTYTQEMVAETAKVFTGWSWATAPPTTTDPRIYISPFPDRIADATHDDTNGWLVPMRYFDAFHDKTEKRIVSLQQIPISQAKPTLLPANQTGPQDLKIVLDTLFNHPNTGPFICRQLIQRLVTSNPSPGYVYRIAQVFANDGNGVRGNLSAVVKAILTDYEARSLQVAGHIGFGKLKEPIIRTTAFIRALRVSAPNGRYLDGYFGDQRSANKWYPLSFANNLGAAVGQYPGMSPTVFNFFTPDYSPAGPLADAGLVAPEMQITDDVFSLQAPTTLMYIMYRSAASLPADAPSPSPFLVIDYAELMPLAKNAPALIDRLNLLFCGNQMTGTSRALIASAVQELPPAATDMDRIQTAIQLVYCSPDGATQK